MNSSRPFFPNRYLINILLSSIVLYASGCSPAQEDSDAAFIGGTKTNNPQNTKAAYELFPENLYDSGRNPVSRDMLKDKFIGIYFSASWCPPCHAFTPTLVQFRDKYQSEFEVVLVGADYTQKDQDDYMKEYDMEWLATKQGTRATERIQKMFNISGIPTLVILAPDGKMITKRGTEALQKNPDAAFESWKKFTG